MSSILRRLTGKIMLCSFHNFKISCRILDFIFLYPSSKECFSDIEVAYQLWEYHAVCEQKNRPVLRDDWEFKREKWCPGPESNRHGILVPRDFKSLASTCFATWAFLKGWGRNRTGVHGFAGRCITTLPPSRKKKATAFLSPWTGAGNEARTRDPNLGKVVLYHWAIPASPLWLEFYNIQQTCQQ